MVLFPHAKINLGLQVIGKRDDGFHDIISCFYPTAWCDVLEIIEADSFRFTSTGLQIPGAWQDNLCVRAYYILKQSYPLPPVHIHLHKAVPIGSGLGAGSSDGAFTITGLNRLFNLNLKEEQLQKIASRLGSDCPFFVRQLPAMAEGRGERLSDISVALQGRYLAVITPPVKIHTAEAYASLTPKKPQVDLREALQGEVSGWKHTVINDFEGQIFIKYPEIAEIKDTLYQAGALFCSLSGSGSSVYGIFSEYPRLKGRFDPSYRIWEQPIEE